MSNPMDLTIPVPQLTTGPQYAQQVSDSLETIASHRHTGEANGDGLQVPSAGLDINEDLSIQNNNLNNLRSVRFTDQAGVLVGVGDIGCVYEVDGDLYYNNGSGTPIQLTSGSSINFVGNLNYGVLSISGNYTIDSADTFTVLECNTTSNNIIVTLPSIDDVPAGRMYIIKDVVGTSETNTIRINAVGINTIDQESDYVIEDNHAAIAVISDGIGNWTLYAYNRKVYFAGDVIKLTGGAQLTSDSSSQVILQGNVSVNNIDIINAGIADATISNDLVVEGDTQFDGDIGGNAGGTVTFVSSATADDFIVKTLVTGIVRVGRAGGFADSSSWVENSNGVWANDALGANLYYYIDIPDGAILTGVRLSVQGANGHADLPAVMPSLQLRRYDTPSQLEFAIATQSDGSGTVGIYQLQHSITISGLNVTIDRSTNVYMLRLTAESGANSLEGMTSIYYEFTYNIPANYSLVSN